MPMNVPVKLEHKKQDTNLLRGLCQATSITMKVFIGTVCVTNELVYMLKFSIHIQDRHHNKSLQRTHMWCRLCCYWTSLRGLWTCCASLIEIRFSCASLIEIRFSVSTCTFGVNGKKPSLQWPGTFSSVRLPVISVNDWAH